MDATAVHFSQYWGPTVLDTEQTLLKRVRLIPDPKGHVATLTGSEALGQSHPLCNSIDLDSPVMSLALCVLSIAFGILDITPEVAS